MEFCRDDVRPLTAYSCYQANGLIAPNLDERAKIEEMEQLCLQGFLVWLIASVLSCMLLLQVPCLSKI